MSNTDVGPPRWAEAMLRSLLRPSDRDSISGDLLEEYRAVEHPALGARRANAWYVTHVLSVLWHLIRPCALTLAGLSVLSLIVKGLWFGSLVQAPGVSFLDALIYVWAGYHASQRTRLITTGILIAGVTSVVGFTAFFLAAAIGNPGLVIVPFSKPFVFVILSVVLVIGLGYSVVLGAVGAVIGRWVAPTAPREVRAS